MSRFIKKIKDDICDYVFTVHCPYCRTVIKKDEYACEECKRKFPEKAIIDYAIGGYRCVCPFLYKGIFRNAVLDFKFNNCASSAKQLSFMLVSAINETYGDTDFDVITCVPMHKKTLKQRGYNQAELLARECAEIMNIEFIDLLEKFKENKAQHNLPSSEKQKNVRGVYRIINKELAYGKNVLIIDDVITTGNTLGECARILMKAKCKNVYCATLCKTVNIS